MNHCEVGSTRRGRVGLPANANVKRFPRNLLYGLTSLLISALMFSSGYYGEEVRSAVIALTAVCVGLYCGHLKKGYTCSLILASPFIITSSVFGVFSEILSSSPVIMFLVLIYFIFSYIGFLSYISRSIFIIFIAYISVLLVPLANSFVTNEYLNLKMGEPESVGDFTAYASTLATRTEKVTVVELWNQYCAPCIENLRYIEPLSDYVNIVPVYITWKKGTTRASASDYVNYILEEDIYLNYDQSKSLRYIPYSIVYAPDGSVCHEGVTGTQAYRVDNIQRVIRSCLKKGT